ncbi:MAG: hypothetical protein HQL87_10770 [Magnetococcales bacterium]|nr:hypothetical protein [Magnetococcales bacterium]
MIPSLLAIHILSAVIWVGGMFFAMLFLRPALLPLELEARVDLWFRVLTRFFPWVWGSVIALPLSGYALLLAIFGSLQQAGWHVWIMQSLGWTMIAIFIFLFLVYYRKMARMVKKRLMPEAGLCMNAIRIGISVNLALGLATVVVAATGRFW